MNKKRECVWQSEAMSSGGLTTFNEMFFHRFTTHSRCFVVIDNPKNG